MKRTTQYALAATLATALMGSSAMAADLGGNCCADLEERIADLEATTVRKGNRRVSLAISGYVSHHVMWWDDGSQSDVYIGDGGNYGSRWRFRGEAKINADLTAGFLYEFAANVNNYGATNQLNWGDSLGASGTINVQNGFNGTQSNTGFGCNAQSVAGLNTRGCTAVRDSTVWLRHRHLGLIKIGHGSTATDNLILIDLGEMAGAASPDVALFGGGMILRGNNGQFASTRGTLFNPLGVTNIADLAVAKTTVTWQAAIRAGESFDTSRRNHVLYETPTLHGFTLQAAVAEDNFWDIALRYAGEFNGVRIAAGVGYLEDTKFNSPAQAFDSAQLSPLDPINQGQLCNRFCDTKSQQWTASGSILHVPTGLFLTAAYGNRELSGQTVINAAGTLGNINVPDLRFWWIAGGVSKNFFGIGKSVLFAEYGEHDNGLSQAQALTGSAAGTLAFDPKVGSEVTTWGIGFVQYVDAAAMDVFLTYKNYSLDTNGFTTASGGNGASVDNTPLNRNVHDLQMFILGSRIQF